MHITLSPLLFDLCFTRLILKLRTDWLILSTWNQDEWFLQISMAPDPDWIDKDGPSKLTCPWYRVSLLLNTEWLSLSCLIWWSGLWSDCWTIAGAIYGAAHSNRDDAWDWWMVQASVKTSYKTIYSVIKQSPTAIFSDSDPAAPFPVKLVVCLFFDYKTSPSSVSSHMRLLGFCSPIYYPQWPQ